MSDHLTASAQPPGKTFPAAGPLSSPRRLFTVVAIAEAVTWALLLAGMFLKYVTRTTELGVSIGGGLHGFVFLAFVVVLAVLGVDARWPLGRIALGLVAAVVPFATIPFERWAQRRGLLPTSWLLRERPARSAPERWLSSALRRPGVAVVAMLVAVAIVFLALLLVGPPGG